MAKTKKQKIHHVKLSTIRGGSRPKSKSGPSAPKAKTRERSYPSLF